MFNASATLNVSRLLYNPALCIPHLTLKSFDQITLPFQFPNVIKGVVLDKDNCFAKDHDDKVWPAYQSTWDRLREQYPRDRLLIVSNSAGTNDDQDHEQAAKLERDTGVTVLRHATKKPGCHGEILAYFAKMDVKPNEILVIGDRLFTDILMANMMGSYGLWLSVGVEESQKSLVRLERGFHEKLAARGWKAPEP